LRLANAHTHFDDVYVREAVSESKYYLFGGRRVAMRRDGMVQYIVGDHVCGTRDPYPQPGGTVLSWGAGGLSYGSSDPKSSVGER
jgi:hypothetical protein